jgi:DNA-binding NarL/FixJ family response regulator
MNATDGGRAGRRRTPGPVGVERFAPVLVADPDPIARRAIREALTATSRFTVAGEAATSDQAVEFARRQRSGVALLELDLPESGGFTATRQIVEVAPEVKVLIVSRQDDEESQLRALSIGAAGFVPKSAELEDVVAGVGAVLASEVVVPPETLRLLLEKLRGLWQPRWGTRPVHSALTQREWEILDLMSQGLDTQQMAQTMVVSEGTIYSHVKHVLRKLGVHSREEAVRAAQHLRDASARIGASEQAGNDP